MRHSLRLVAVLLGFAASACTDQHSTIWISQVSAPALEDGACTASDVALVSSSWSPASGQPYAQFLTVVNAVRSNASDVANDSNWVQIQGIEVTLTDVNGNVLADTYSMPAGGTIPSASGPTSLGQTTIGATIIPAGVGSFAAGTTVIATIVPYGTTLGGLEVEGPPFSWPITITNPPACTICEDDASAFDLCSPGQDNACTVIPQTDPACADA